MRAEDKVGAGQALVSDAEKLWALQAFVRFDQNHSLRVSQKITPRKDFGGRYAPSTAEIGSPYFPLEVSAICSTAVAGGVIPANFGAPKWVPCLHRELPCGTYVTEMLLILFKRSSLLRKALSFRLSRRAPSEPRVRDMWSYLGAQRGCCHYAHSTYTAFYRASAMDAA